MDTILVIDDDPNMRDLLAELLAGSDRLILKSDSAIQGLNIIQNKTVHLILTDINMPDMDGIEFIRKTKELHVTTPIITITAYTSTDTAIQALRAGAYDYLSKPFAHEELLKTVENTLRAVHLFQEVTYLRGKLDTAYKFENIIGQCHAMQHTFGIIRRIRDADCNVLITGESGTGKDVLAQAIHNTSSRKDTPFVAVNCTSIPEMLLESELFGHTQGAFTGAVKDKAGLIETAHTGTLFLDEIGDMPISLQPKLLQVLQNHTIRKVGSTRMIPVDIRIIAATNQNLKEKIANGSFRKDLYYRLSVVELSVPPLRERGNDISLLAGHFLKRFCEKLKKPIYGFSTEAHKALTNYAWPGNIRELENAVEHAATLCQTDRIELSDLPVSLQHALQPSNVSTGTLDEQVFQFEEQCLRTTLKKCNYDFAAATQKLGVSLPTLYRKAKKHQLSPKAVKSIDIADPQMKTEKKSDRQPHLF